MEFVYGGALAASLITQRRSKVFDTTQLMQGLTKDLTRTEGIALLALLEHMGVPLQETLDAEAPQRERTWTRAQKAAQSRRMKAYWRGRSKSK